MHSENIIKRKCLEKQAQREGGQFLILFPEGDTAAGLSTLPSDMTMQNTINPNISIIFFK